MLLKKLKQKKGFTLVEVIIAFTVLSILAAVAFPSIAGIISNVKKASDNTSLKVLNQGSLYYATRNNKSSDIFGGLSTNYSRMEELVGEGFISSTLTAKESGAYFNWNKTSQSWEVKYTDPEVLELANSVTTTSTTTTATYDDYVTTSTLWDYGDYDNYNPSSWNGYLEKLFEKGQGDNTRLTTADEGYGKNTLNYTNPYSGQETIVNWNNWDQVESDTSLSALLPAAIILTNDSRLSTDQSSNYIKDHVSALKGSMIVYKADSATNDQTLVYYVKEDGSLSSSQTIDMVMP